MLMIELPGIPYTGTWAYNDSDLLYFGYLFAMLGKTYADIREFKVKVIKEIPNLQKEWAGT